MSKNLGITIERQNIFTTMRLSVPKQPRRVARENCHNGNFETPKLSQPPQHPAYSASPPAPPANRAHPLQPRAEQHAVQHLQHHQQTEPTLHNLQHTE